MTSLPTTVSIIPRIRPQSLASILKYEVLEECQLFVVLKRARTIGHSSSVCPDWASFESSCATNFLTNVVKDNYYLLGYLETPHFLSKNWCVCIFWGNFRKLLGYFMIQNLVTLPATYLLLKSFWDNKLLGICKKSGTCFWVQADLENDTTTFSPNYGLPMDQKYKNICRNSLTDNAVNYGLFFTYLVCVCTIMMSWKYCKFDKRLYTFRKVVIKTTFAVTF